ncbi:scoloptoxin SSD14-like isoform X2 [Macrobrachium nipponense]|uniref:scoloptoxin SSD14-like isoform X2 n=1 Tax=Macrobrachium nipponense TaxID=159736 RepID=UPI0030C861C3
MGKKTKKIRAQLHQYRRDEMGSYSLITQWNSPLSSSGPDHASTSSFRMIVTRKQLVITGVVLTACIVAIATGIVVGVPLYGGAEAEKDEPNQPVEQQVITKVQPKSEGRFESWGSNENKNRQGPETDPPPSPTILGEYEHAAVSADGQPCAQIARDILERNGTAADAAIAGLFCVGVVNTQSMGLGGGFLLTYYDRAERKAHTLIARETAPAAAFEDMYDGDEELMQKGGLAVGVPGEVRGYYEFYKKFGGRIPWNELLEPSIKLCEEGHPVNWHMARALKFGASDIMQEPSMSVFINPETGEVYKEGEILKRPKLGQTLRVLQYEPDALYTGELSKKLVEDIQNFGGIISHEDLVNYRPLWKEPMNVSLENGGLTMYSVPPPGSGHILGFILNILDEYDINPSSFDDENVVLSHQRFTEAMKWAYAKRTELGDADFVDIFSLAKNLTSDAYAADIHEQITDDRTFQDPSHYGAVTAVDDNHGTAHFSLLSPEGDAVSVTSTVNLYFGAGIRSVQTGIVLNDEMDDFSAPNITSYFGIPPSPANFIRPGKRPLSSMCPTVFVDSKGDVRLIIGAAGGTKISSAVAWASLRNLWLKEDIKKAIDARRIHHQIYPMTLSYEDGITNKIVSGLQEIGHDTKQFSVGGSVICAVARGENGKLYANADFRKSGEVDGF